MNKLQYEKSPYLLQHADNPVDWRPWGDEAFAAALEEDKPIFLSIGYSTCHWCHVMARESFSDPEVADILNREFIPIKVDREERPDVDAVYMAACVAAGGSGGWPLTLLLTPEQKPFWAGTYLPKGSLMVLLKQAARLWRDNREEAESTGEALTEHLQNAPAFAPGTPRRELAEKAAASFASWFDARWGGFGGAPKFPSAHQLLFLLRYAQLTGDKRPREMAEITLEHLYRGGIYDHVGGGFARYATDHRWLIPHFEKMLYDNALLALSYTEAYHMTGRAVYRRVAEETLQYVLRELTDQSGGFFCGQDADSDEVEGKFYTFSRSELSAVLQTDSERFCDRFGVTEKGNFEGGQTVLNLIGTDDWETEPADIAAMRRVVYEYRKQRESLHRDDKVLTAWNGLMIAALARAGLIFDQPRYRDAATRAAAFIEQHLRDQSGKLLARFRDGDAAHPAKLDDYAFYAWGLLELYEVTFEVGYLKAAIQAADQLLNRFFDRENGGFYPYAADEEQLITRSKDTYDGAMPSGNAVAALVLSRLSRLTGEPRFQAAFDTQMRYLSGGIESYPIGHGFALMSILESCWPTQELVITTTTMPEELPRFLRKAPRPNLTVLVKTPENADRLRAVAPFTEAYPIPESGARYYLCRDGACEAPVESVEALKVEDGNRALFSAKF